MSVCHTPTGIFDSGIGGLSVLKALRAELPHENFIYIADSAYAPYGGRDAACVIARSKAITVHLVSQNIKALVIACNTTTATAIDVLRAGYPGLPIIGVEPALKPEQRPGAGLNCRQVVKRYVFNSVLRPYLLPQSHFYCINTRRMRTVCETPPHIKPS